jgi:hypothetical protein
VFVRTALRVLASGFAFLLTDIVANLVLAMVPGLDVVPILPPLIALVLGGAAALRVWQRTEPRTGADPAVVESTLQGAAVLGGIGFAAGFFGPIVFAPDANQGPLLGIFITGPIGVVLGAIAGYVRGVRRSARPAP